MSDGDAVLAIARAIVARVAGPGRTPPDLGPDTKLGGGLWLDSLELLEVIVGCEHEFGITFEDTTNLETDVLETLGTLVTAVRVRQSALERQP
jgi:acyl carrier protein